MLILPQSQQLKAYYSVPKEYLAQDIWLLMKVHKPRNCDQSIFKFVNTLRRNGFYTIEDILNTSPKRIQLLKGIGDKSFLPLLDVLKALSEN